MITFAASPGRGSRTGDHVRRSGRNGRQSCLPMLHGSAPASPAAREGDGASSMQLSVATREVATRGDPQVRMHKNNAEGARALRFVGVCPQGLLIRQLQNLGGGFWARADTSVRTCAASETPARPILHPRSATTVGVLKRHITPQAINQYCGETCSSSSLQMIHVLVDNTAAPSTCAFSICVAPMQRLGVTCRTLVATMMCTTLHTSSRGLLPNVSQLWFSCAICGTAVITWPSHGAACIMSAPRGAHDFDADAQSASDNWTLSCS